MRINWLHSTLNKTAMYSYDIFDTCLVRLCAKPYHLYWFAASEVAQSVAGNENPTELTWLLYRARRQAESTTRTQAPHREITYQQIYDAIEIPETYQPLLALLQAKELELEKQFLVPVVPIKNEIKALRAEGHSLVYISDMYLPEEFIQNLLVEKGFWEEGDRLYVSNTSRLSKEQGDLFDHVKEVEGAEFGSWFHVGDNPFGDIAMANARGIQTRLFSAALLTRFEEESLADEYLGFAERSLLAGLSRAARLSVAGEHSNPAAHVFSGVTAPLYTAFLRDMFKSAESAGLEQLYFLARDGQLMYKMSKALQKSGGLGLNYLYGSRRAWLPFLLNPTSLSEKLHWLEAEKTYDPELILKIFNLEPEKYSAVLIKFRETSWTRRPVAEQVAAFIADPDVHAAIEAAAREHLELIEAYLRQEGLSGDGEKGLVDVGWSIRMQDVLNEILDSRLGAKPLRGIYMGGVKDRLKLGEPGEYSCWLREEEVFEEMPNSGSYMFMYILVFEQIFGMADHPSVIGYKRVGERLEPRFLEGVDAVSSLCESLHSVCVAYAEHARNVQHWLNPRLCKSHSLFLLRYFFSSPQSAEVAALSSLCVDTSMDEKGRKPFVDPLSLTECIGLALGPDEKRKAVRYWLQGSLAITGRWKRILYRLLRRLAR